jgi:hypothetical protein
MTDSTKVLLSIFTIVSTNILGHYFPPISIILSPVTIGLVTRLLITINFKLTYRILLISLTIMLNDISIKTYAGGTHDSEGAGFINLFLIIGLIISVIIIIEKTILNKPYKFNSKITLIIFFPTIMFFYLQYFSDYGLTYPKPMNSTKEEALSDNTFISDLIFSQNQIFYNDDSIQLTTGWTEKERLINHKFLLRKSRDTENINYKIKIKHNFKQYVNSAYYKVNSDDIIGATPIDSVLEFRANKSDLITLTIFKIKSDHSNKDTIIGRVNIKRI